MAASSFPYTSSARHVKPTDRFTPSTPLKTQGKSIKRQKTSSSASLQNKFLKLIKQINTDNPILPAKQRAELTQMLQKDRLKWVDGENNTIPLEFRCETALILALHYSHTETENSSDQAKHYHAIATESWGKGKFDVRGDAAFNAGEFYAKNPTLENLKKAARYFKTAAKSTYYYSQENAESSAYTHAANTYGQIAQIFCQNEDQLKADKYEKKAKKCTEKAKLNLAEKNEVAALGTLPMKKKIQQKTNADRLYKECTTLCRLAKESGSLTQEQALEIESLLGHAQPKWLNLDTIQCQKNLKARSKLALYMAHHCAVADPEKAVFYYKMALEKFSIGKYDVNGRAYESYARYLLNRAGALSEETVAIYEEASRCFAIAAKSTYIYSTETNEHSSYSDAGEIHFKLSSFFASVGHTEKSEEHRIKAIKYSTQALKIKGSVTQETLTHLKQGFFLAEQNRAVTVLENCLGGAALPQPNGNTPLEEREIGLPNTSRGVGGKRNRIITDD